MVKGVARRVIMVPSPDPKLFEQAMFLVKEEAFDDASPQDVLQEAEKSAKAYLNQQNPPPKPKKLSPYLSFFSGAVCATALWFISQLYL